MKFLLKTILIVVLAAISQSFFPWWGMSLAAALVCFVMSSRPPKRRFTSSTKPPEFQSSFIAGLLGGALVWGLAAFWLNYQNDSLLGDKIAAIITQAPNAYIMIVITALMGGLLAGFGGMTGDYLGEAVKAVEWKWKKRRR